MKAALRSLLAVIGALLLSGCAVLGITTKVEVIHERVTLESGVEYEDIIVGEGRAAELGQTVVIDYVGHLASGAQFDSSIERGIPVTLVLGEAPLSGWNEAIPGMMAGGSRWMRLPAEQAYGSAGVPGLIPPDEPLVFEIDLIEILPE